MFALGEAVCRFCLFTDHKEMAMTIVVSILVMILLIPGVVLRGRATFFRTKKINVRQVLIIEIIFITGMLWAYIYYGNIRILPAGTRIEGEFVLLEKSESEQGYSCIFEGDGVKFYSFVEGDALGRNASSDSSEGASKSVAVGDALSVAAGASSDEEFLRVGRGYRITAKVSEASSASNPGQFDMKRYLSGKGVVNCIKLERIERFPERDSLIRSFLSDRRTSLADSLDRLLQPKYAGILKAMLLGDKTDLDARIRKMYQKNGIAHLLAISALHVALIASFCKALLRLVGFGRKKRAVLTIAFLCLYGIMTGFSEATQRAFIILSVSCMAEALGRTADKPTALSFSFLVMMIIQPQVIISSGFRMSYAAALGVTFADSIYRSIYGDERFTDMNRRYRKRFKLLVRGTVGSVTINACMLPVLLETYCEIPLYSLLINALVIPMLTIVVAGGFIASIIGLIPGCIYIAKAVLLPAKMILWFYEKLCSVMLKLPAALLNPGHPEMYAVIVYIILLILLFVYIIFSSSSARNDTAGVLRKLLKKENRRLRKKEDRRLKRKEKERLTKTVERHLKKSMKVSRLHSLGEDGIRRYIERRYAAIYFTGCFILAAGLLCFSFFSNRHTNFAAFLDVGQGNSILIHTSDGVNIIYDGGSSSNKKSGENIILPALKYYGMSHIDLVMLSHGDIDHVNGLVYLFEEAELEGLKLDRLCIAEGAVMTKELQKLLSAADAIGCEVIYGYAGMGFAAGNAEIKVLYPEKTQKTAGGFGEDGKAFGSEKLSEGVESLQGGETNEKSLVVRVDFSGTSILLTGDIGFETEERILQNMETKELTGQKTLKTDILQCPHHGSAYSSSEEFIAAVSPRMVVISCGKHNRYGHPAMSTLERLDTAGCDVFRTDHSGCITINIKRGNLNVSEYTE